MQAWGIGDEHDEGPAHLGCEHVDGWMVMSMLVVSIVMGYGIGCERDEGSAHLGYMYMSYEHSE